MLQMGAASPQDISLSLQGLHLHLCSVQAHPSGCLHVHGDCTASAFVSMGPSRWRYATRGAEIRLIHSQHVPNPPRAFLQLHGS